MENSDPVGAEIKYAGNSYYKKIVLTSDRIYSGYAGYLWMHKTGKHSMDDRAYTGALISSTNTRFKEIGGPVYLITRELYNINPNDFTYYKPIEHDILQVRMINIKSESILFFRKETDITVYADPDNDLYLSCFWLIEKFKGRYFSLFTFCDCSYDKTKW